MRVATAAVACLALVIGACTATPAKPSPSASLPVTDLSSVTLPTPTPTAQRTPTPPRTPTPAPTPTPPPTPIELSPTGTPAPTPTTAPTNAPSIAASLAASLSPGASAAADCVNGWTAPAAGSPEYSAGLATIQEQMNVTGPWTVDEMRYFTGPDVPWIIDPHFDVVDYLYVKASRTDDPSFSGRWLLEYRSADRQGIAAVAPYATTGYKSPDWTGFTGDGSPQIYTDLPGTWAGVPYDFVTGEGDSGQPGLPDQVIGCLSGT